MSNRYSGNQQGWSGHRGRGGNFRGQSCDGRGHGGWNNAEHQRSSSEGHQERHSAGWNQLNSSGPSQSNQQWHNRGFDSGRGHGQRHSQEQHLQNHREAGRFAGSVDHQRRHFDAGSNKGPGHQHQNQWPGDKSNQGTQANGQQTGNKAGGWPPGNQHDQLVSSGQRMPMPPYNLNPTLAPVPPGAPQVQGQLPMSQGQSHPGSFVPPNSLNQPQIAHGIQQQLQPNRTQPFPGANPMMPLQAFHQPLTSAPPDILHPNASHTPMLPPQHPSSGNQGRTLLHPGQSIEAGQTGDGVKTQRKVDEEWVRTFLYQVRRVPVTDAKGTFMSISEGRQAIRHYLVLLSKLEKLRDTLMACIDSDANTWQHECDRAYQLKVQLNEAKKKIHDPTFVPGLLERIARSKKKRESIARRKKREYLAGKEKEDRKRRVNEKIDAVVAKKQKAIQDAKNEAALQAEADSTLFEVRKKKQDADKTMEMLRALRKLRSVRKDTAAQKGAYTTLESDKNFEESVSKLEAMMNKARSTYREEEQTLLVMLEEEQEENKERQLEIIRQRQRDKALKAVQKRKEMLFGKDEFVGPDDPMFPFQQFYSLAESNLPSLIEIRKQWDTFLVPPDDPNGSGIPTDWVIPSGPSSEVWASVLQDIQRSMGVSTTRYMTHGIHE